MEHEADFQRLAQTMRAYNIQAFRELNHREPGNNKEVDTWIEALNLKHRDEYKLQRRY